MLHEKRVLYEINKFKFLIQGGGEKAEGVVKFSKTLHVKCGVKSLKSNEKVSEFHRKLEGGYVSTSKESPVVPD